MSEVQQSVVQVEVGQGSVPTVVLGSVPDEGGPAASVPAVVVVPSVFGPTSELVGHLAQLGESALTCVPDPFWRTGEGALAYGDLDTAMARMSEFDLQVCREEMGAVAAWAREHSNGTVIGLGICFGGPFVLRMAADKELDGVVTWHGSRMEKALKRAGDISCPVRHHLGGSDPVTPPEVISALRKAFDGHPDAEVVVHKGADHGFSHEGPSWDPVAFESAFGSLRELVDRNHTADDHTGGEGRRFGDAHPEVSTE